VLRKLYNLYFLLFKKIFFVKITVIYLKEKGELSVIFLNNIIDLFSVYMLVCTHHKFKRKIYYYVLKKRIYIQNR